MLNLIVSTMITIIFTWWVMLFLGNLGVDEMSFVSCVPAGLVLMELAQIEINGKRIR